MKPGVFLQPAEEEMVEAARFYEQRHIGLGVDFLVEVEHCIARMRENPEEIVIVAVMHLRRRPDYWRGR